jgi:MFS family permease
MAAQSGHTVPPSGNAQGAGGGELSATLYSWVVIVLALLVFAVSFVDRLAWSVVIPVAAPAMKISMTEAGGLMTAFYIGYVFSNLPAGWLVDRFGPKLTLGVCTIVTGVFTLLFPLTDNYTMGFILRVGAGLGGGAIFACGVKFQLGWFPMKLRGVAMGIYNATAQLGSVIFPTLLGLILDLTGSNYLYIMATLGSGYLLAAVLVTFMDDRTSRTAQALKSIKVTEAVTA